MPDAASDEVRNILEAAYETARRDSAAASELFDEMIRAAPTGASGLQAIRDAANEYTAARDGLLSALHRLNGFVLHGIVPEDLRKPPGKQEGSNSGDRSRYLT
jgi:hypothetical protein